MRTKVAFEGINGIRYPASNGKSLVFADGEVNAAIKLRFEYQDPRKPLDSREMQLQTDVVACDLWLPDSEGRVWKTTSRTTTEVFVRHMVDISSAEGFLFTLDRAPADFTRAFSDGPVLRDARFSSDDRFYRRIVLGGRIVEFQFYYTMMPMDVAVVCDDPWLVKLAVRVGENCLVQRSDIEEDDLITVPPFGYYMDWRLLLLANTAEFAAGYNRWRDAAIPAPLVFTLTDETDAPQPQVRAV